jgi:ubiquinone/menaquinone biosynthesis C-methylase UbiE
MNEIASQFGHPRGLLGRIVGAIMAIENRERIEWAIGLLEVRPADHLLEIGFGPGIGIERLAALASSGFVAGVDISDVMVAQASRRNARGVRAGQIELKQGSADDLPYPENTFDKLLAINSLHHWENRQTALREVHRALKPGGVIAVVEQPPTKVTDAKEMEQRGNEIRDILSQAGFGEIESISGSLRRGLSVFIRGRKSNP